VWPVSSQMSRIEITSGGKLLLREEVIRVKVGMSEGVPQRISLRRPEEVRGWDRVYSVASMPPQEWPKRS